MFPSPAEGVRKCGITTKKNQRGYEKQKPGAEQKQPHPHQEAKEEKADGIKASKVLREPGLPRCVCVTLRADVRMLRT